MATKKTADKKKPLKRTPEQLRAEWVEQATAFREELGLDLRDTRAFSRYLVAVYGAKSDPRWQKLFFDDAQNMLLAGYREGLLAWQQAMAPEGLVAARGLHTVSFLPGDDIAGMIILHRDSNEDGEGTSNYTMNAPVASWLFSTRSLLREGHVVSPLLARSIAAQSGKFDEKDLTGRMISLDDEDGPSGKHRAVARGSRPARPAKREFSLSERGEILGLCKQLSQPVVLVADIDKNNFRAFGGDSESGDTLEAEIKVTTCEPACLAHLFVASRTPVGDPVGEDVARYHALNEHWEIQGKFFSYGDDVTLYLHPETDLGLYRKGAKLVKHLPPGFRWYEVSKGA